MLKDYGHISGWDVLLGEKRGFEILVFFLFSNLGRFVSFFLFFA